MKNYFSEQIIDSLRTEFIQEATNAPKLFKDLAKVEHYYIGFFREKVEVYFIKTKNTVNSI